MDDLDQVIEKIKERYRFDRELAKNLSETNKNLDGVPLEEIEKEIRERVDREIRERVRKRVGK